MNPIRSMVTAARALRGIKFRIDPFPTRGRYGRPASLVLALWLASCAGAACDSGVAATPLPAFDAARAWTHLEKIVGFGPRPAGSARLRAARTYIEDQLRASGLEPQLEAFKKPTPIGEIEFANVYADLASERPAPDDRMVIICAHYDTKRLPFHFVGANDAGSSTAVLLELARSLASSPTRSGVVYRFLFLDGEESVRPDWAGSTLR